MKESSRKAGGLAALVGLLASASLAALFVLYIFCFLGILLAGPAFTWTGMQAFLGYVQTHDQTLKYLSYAGMMVFGAAWVVLGECICEWAGAARKLPARIGSAFGAMFALASGINYFLQLTCVRLNLLRGTPGGLEQLVMADPVSAAASVNMLGWTLLLGLSALGFSFAFERGGRPGAARISLLALAAVCLAGCAGFVLNCVPVVAVCMYPLLGGAVLAVAAALFRLFRAGNSQNRDSTHSAEVSCAL